MSQRAVVTRLGFFKNVHDIFLVNPSNLKKFKKIHKNLKKFQNIHKVYLFEINTKKTILAIMHNKISVNVTQLTSKNVYKIIVIIEHSPTS